MQESLYLLNTRWRYLHTSGVPPAHGVDDAYPFLCKSVQQIKRYRNLCQISKWRTGGPGGLDKIDIHRFGMTQRIHRHQYHNFLTNCSEVISKKVNFWYLNTHRWRCSQLWHGPSDHGVDEVYQVWFRLIKVWPRYSI